MRNLLISSLLQNILSICTLFNDALSSPDQIYLNGKTMSELGRVWLEEISLG